jgi:hypothetical protein
VEVIDMTTWIQKNWRRISTGLLVLSLAGVGASELYRSLNGEDCCKQGASCCKPGAACCKGHNH